MSKLVLLTIHFPRLRLLWANTPQLTAQIFDDLISDYKDNMDESEVVSEMINSTKELCVETNENPIPCEFLSKMPGMEISYKYIIRKVKNLKDLCSKSESELAEILGNTEKANKLYRFINMEHLV